MMCPIWKELLAEADPVAFESVYSMDSAPEIHPDPHHTDAMIRELMGVLKGLFSSVEMQPVKSAP
jgi:hypothetical protein